MEEINNIEVVPCTESDYLKPFRVHYNQNGTKKSWDFMRTHDSVSVLIFNTTSHCFVLVKQFRPEKWSGVGVTGAKQTMFYAEVSDDNCVSAGGGEPREGELIEVVKVPLHEAMTFAYNERIQKTMGVIFSFIWFHNNMSPKYKISTNV
ncbi:uridine diphosphate glucose pyrophosphatase [Seriola lalandi dorsalis]|uniref:uridine diphosphate glucose pyrophosphatase n=1 Tax=Seriola lalandi dorsalis TaxID=1841481 RepID=UPI000C6F7809|nr:uridine diphosphate glucose pyrophosphatase [Seriola lalandi dorsalis]